MDSNHTGDGFLFDMAIEEADRETVEWLGGQEYYQKISFLQRLTLLPGGFHLKMEVKCFLQIQ